MRAAGERADGDVWLLVGPVRPMTRPPLWPSQTSQTEGDAKQRTTKRASEPPANHGGPSQAEHTLHCVSSLAAPAGWRAEAIAKQASGAGNI